MISLSNDYVINTFNLFFYPTKIYIEKKYTIYKWISLAKYDLGINNTCWDGKSSRKYQADPKVDTLSFLSVISKPHIFSAKMLLPDAFNQLFR